MDILNTSLFVKISINNIMSHPILKIIILLVIGAIIPNSLHAQSSKKEKKIFLEISNKITERSEAMRQVCLEKQILERNNNF